VLTLVVREGKSRRYLKAVESLCGPLRLMM